MFAPRGNCYAIFYGTWADVLANQIGIPWIFCRYSCFLSRCLILSVSKYFRTVLQARKSILDLPEVCGECKQYSKMKYLTWAHYFRWLSWQVLRVKASWPSVFFILLCWNKFHQGIKKGRVQDWLHWAPVSPYPLLHGKWRREQGQPGSCSLMWSSCNGVNAPCFA